jgi:hypothetical protein
MTPPPVDDGKERYIGNLLLPLIVLALAAVCFVQALDFRTGDDVGPAAVPYLWSVFLVVFCVALIVQAVLRKIQFRERSALSFFLSVGLLYIWQPLNPLDISSARSFSWSGPCTP